MQLMPATAQPCQHRGGELTTLLSAPAQAKALLEMAQAGSRSVSRIRAKPNKAFLLLRSHHRQPSLASIRLHHSPCKCRSTQKTVSRSAQWAREASCAQLSTLMTAGVLKSRCMMTSTCISLILIKGRVQTLDSRSSIPTNSSMVRRLLPL